VAKSRFFLYFVTPISRSHSHVWDCGILPLFRLSLRVEKKIHNINSSFYWPGRGFYFTFRSKEKKTGRDADKSFKSFNTTANKLFVLIKQNLFTIVLSDKQILVQYQH